MALESNFPNVFPKPMLKPPNDENTRTPTSSKGLKNTKAIVLSEKEQIIGQMCLKLLHGKQVSEISKEIVQSSDSKRALIFTEYFQTLLQMELEMKEEILGKRNYDELYKEKKEKGIEMKEKKILKTEERMELSEEEKMLNLLAYYRHVPFFVENIQSLSLFQQELADFKKFAGTDREKIIDEAMKSGFNPIQHIYLFKKKQKTLMEIIKAKKKSTETSGYWDLIIEYIRSLMDQG